MEKEEYFRRIYDLFQNGYISKNTYETMFLYSGEFINKDEKKEKRGYLHD